MAVESGGTELGMQVPDTALPDLDGTPVALRAYRGEDPLVIIWAANHCPYVRHVEAEVGRIADENPDVRFLAIVSNDPGRYPGDGVTGAREQAERAGWRFPYLIDADQSAAKAFGAACTPDFFVFDAGGALTYRGALDASSPKNGQPVTANLLRDAIARTLAGQEVPLPHRPALGCGIKWLPGNEPETINFV